MDTTAVTTVQTTSTTTILHAIQGSLDGLHWLLLFLGWFMYWLKALNTCRQASAGKPFFSNFWANNFLEVPISAVSCLVLAVIAPTIPTDLIDLKGQLAVFIVGYSSSSVLNGLITTVKPSIKGLNKTQSENET